MKRVALKRKTPLRSGGRLRPMSRAKAAMQPRYRLYKRVAVENQIDEHGCTWCERCEKPGPVDPHHPGGRVGENLLTFFLICRDCHDWIHANTKAARVEGWMK